MIDRALRICDEFDPRPPLETADDCARHVFTPPFAAGDYLYPMF